MYHEEKYLMESLSKRKVSTENHYAKERNQ